jgi:hypothetical protein
VLAGEDAFPAQPGPGPHAVRRLIVDRSDGTPGSTLALACRAIQSHDPARGLSQPSLTSRVQSEVSEPASRLFEELVRAGTAGPSDERLLQRLGWTRSRAYQVFAELEDAGSAPSPGRRPECRGRARFLKGHRCAAACGRP